MKPCIVCKSETDKYKCPKCLEYYCSVDCCKTHRENGCEQKAPIQEAKPKNDESKLMPPFTTEDTIHPDKLRALKDSEGLRNLLYNRHLRTLLKEIDDAPGAWKAMKVAMQEPLFLEFADECLKVVEPPETEADA